VELKFYSFDLKFRYPFKIASGIRTTTPVVFTELSVGGMTGYGEAALPPYLPENQESVIAWLKLLDLRDFNESFSPGDVISQLENESGDNFPAMAAIDMALHDLYGKIHNRPVHRIWADDTKHMPLNSYTLGMDTPAILTEKLKEAGDFSLLKVKLGGPYDNLIIKTVREHTTKALCVDANQGWNDEFYALDMICRLAEQNVLFVEQPFPKEDKKKYEWLFQRSPLPVIADESIQTSLDLDEAAELFHGINIKLMKCGGMQEAYRMIIKAKALNMKILIGCMSESSCGVTAAAQLASFADWTDLDGPLLITNDPFTGISYKYGRIVLSDAPGNGVEKRIA